MARATDQRFYGGPKWQRERKAYKQTHPFCERCLTKGLYVPADLVHHKEYLDDSKAMDPKVSLNFDNLESLCYRCHNIEHHKGKIRKRDRRWQFINGELKIEERPPVI